MNKDLRKVVILLAHPNMKGSQANKALIDAVGDIEGVAVFNLYELSPDIAFNVDEWSKIISDASAVIYQFPFYWMSAPSLLKKWQQLPDLNSMLTAAEEGMVSLWTNFYALIRAVLSIQVWCGRLLSLFMEWEQRMRERISLKEQIHTDSG